MLPRGPPFPVMLRVAIPQPNTRQHMSLVLTRRPFADADSSPPSPALIWLPWQNQTGFLRGDLTSECERWRRARHLKPASSVWDGVYVHSPTVCNIPTTFNLPFLSLFACLISSSGSFIRNILVPLLFPILIHSWDRQSISCTVSLT